MTGIEEDVCRHVGWGAASLRTVVEVGWARNRGYQLWGREAQAVRNEDPDVSQALKTHLADLTGSSSPLGEAAAYLPSQHGQHSLCPRYHTKGLTFNVH